MATYKQIQFFLKEKYLPTFKSCWIAHVKCDFGLTRGKSPNRKDPDTRMHSCSDKYRDHIIDALRHFGMI